MDGHFMKIDDLIKQLNEDQKELFERIIKRLKNKEKCLQK